MNTVELKKKKIEKLSDLTGITTLEFPTGESIILNKILEPKDIAEISGMWGKAYSEEMRRIVMESKLKVLAFLKTKGYEPLRQEKIRLV